MSAAPTALVLHADCGRHDTGWRHPEHQGRLPAVLEAVYRETPALLDRVLQREATPAAVEDLLRVHTLEHVERVRADVERAERNGQSVNLDWDTVVSAASWDAALAAAGCAVTAARLVLDGEAATAFGACRPPGHHATATRAMGFCLFNNAAIAARWAQTERGVRRVLIVDWDVHHGNGTQDIFYHDPDVFYLSLHLAHHYPGTGHAHERGAGAGEDCTLNVPLAPGTGGAAYRDAFGEALRTALRRFEPELIVVSAGFDCLAGDPLGGMLLEPADLHAVACEVLAVASGRIVALLEGGYVPARVGTGVVDVLRAFVGLPPASS